MGTAEICVVLSFLVIVLVIARMLKAIRLLDGRVSLLQEQLSHGHEVMRKAAASKPRTLTPIGVPTMRETRRTPDPSGPGEQASLSVDDPEVEAWIASVTAEHERLKKAMGRDFQVRPAKRSAGEVRGIPVRQRLTSQEIAAKLVRK